MFGPQVSGEWAPLTSIQHPFVTAGSYDFLRASLGEKTGVHSGVSQSRVCSGGVFGHPPDDYNPMRQVMMLVMRCHETLQINIPRYLVPTYIVSNHLLRRYDWIPESCMSEASMNKNTQVSTQTIPSPPQPPCPAAKGRADGPHGAPRGGDRRVDERRTSAAAPCGASPGESRTNKTQRLMDPNQLLHVGSVPNPGCDSEGQNPSELRVVE